MSFLSRFLDRFKAAPAAQSQAATAPAYAGAGPALSLGGSGRQWAAEAGDLTTNSAISILLSFVCNTFADGRFGVKRLAEDGTEELVLDHDVARLMKRPNPRWTRTQLLTALLISRYLSGNAYLYKARSAAGRVVELWWLPHDLVKPVLDKASGEITGYEYKVGSVKEIYAPEDVVHLKSGVNLASPALGSSPLRALLREVCTDNEVQTYTYSILRNMGVPGAILTPKNSEDEIDEPLAMRIKSMWREKTTGDNRGEALVFAMPMDITSPGMKPGELLIDKIAQLSEARLAGAFGIPAVVVQFIVGLQNVNAKASYAECIQQAYGCCILPLQREMCEWFDLQLLPELGDENREYCTFDNSQVAALQEDVNNLHKRADEGYKAGTLKRSEARSMKAMGLVNTPEDEVYFNEVSGGMGMGALGPFEALFAGPTPAAGSDEGKALRKELGAFVRWRAGQGGTS